MTLFLVTRQIIGRLIAALASEARTVVRPATAGLTWPCIAMVAAATVVLALLTSPPRKPTASTPEAPKSLPSNAPVIWIATNIAPNRTTFPRAIGDEETNYREVQTDLARDFSGPKSRPQESSP